MVCAVRLGWPSRAAADSLPGYARFCTLMTAGAAPGGHYRSAMADQAKHDRDGLVPDTALAELVAQRLHLPSPPTIVARKVESIDMSVVR